MALQLDIQDVLGDMARPNLFEVEIPFLGKDFKFKCRASKIPGRTIGQVAVAYQNRKINLAGDLKFETWACTIYNDENQLVRQQMVDWSSLCHASGREITGDKPENYKKIATVRHFARDGKTVTSVEQITGIWPTQLGDVELNWETNDAVETFECTFSIDWAEAIPAV